jgi:hypothetical protein
VVLDLAKVDAIDWGFWCVKNWRWHRQYRTAEFRIDPTSGLNIVVTGVKITYYAHDDVGRCTTVKTVEHAAIQDLEVGFGGVRRWICCPGCQRRCRILYGGDRLRCRLCLGLRYRSQMMQVQDRADYRRHKLALKLNPKGKQDDSLPVKPKWMRWHTYERFGEQFDLLEAVWLTNSPLFRRIWPEAAAEARSDYAAWRAERRAR